MRAARRRIPAEWLPFIGPKTGLARRLYSLAVDPDDLAVHHVFPDATSIARLLGWPHEMEARAGGVGFSVPEAIGRALGELVERYAAFAEDGERALWSSHGELVRQGLKVVAPEFLGLFLAEQYSKASFGYAPFDTAVPMGWLPGVDLLNGESVYAPGQLIGLGYKRRPAEPRIGQATSSGCAVARTAEQAAYRALLELIERDAVMVRWYARLSPERLDIDPGVVLGCDPVDGLDIRFHDLSLDVNVPVVGVTCVEDTGRQCYLILSAAADLDPMAAARKALLEAAQGRPFIKSLALTMESPAPDAAFGDLESNLRFYGDPGNARFVDWFRAVDRLSRRAWPRDPNGSAIERLNILLDRVAAAGLTPIAFDLTTPEIREHGLIVCKVMVPELVPLCIPRAPTLGHPRLRSYIDRAPDDRPGADVPAWVPHPFP